MGYRLLADITVAVHISFVAFVVVGGFLSLRWPRVLYAHVAAVAWVCLLMVGLNVTCPLTTVENWARERGGEGGIPQGFVEAHLTGTLYPSDMEWLFRTLVGVAIAGSWFLLARLTGSRRSAA
ncbi:DUF2784 domain-containing protein [Catenulispora subtropica]|uniref:DUF2784 domain-containing protein n=1 Tax=Catenulispora subtropica TaxID=450798 RepID=A0ABN2RGN7_9ACTN